MNSTMFQVPKHFDFFSYDKPSASENMAIDETLYHSVIKGQRQAVFRVYGWDKPSISIGQFQNCSTLDLTKCGKENIPVVRRITGGRGFSTRMKSPIQL